MAAGAQEEEIGIGIAVEVEAGIETERETGTETETEIGTEKREGDLGEIDLALETSHK